MIQCKVSNSVIFFKKGFFDLWNLKEYSNQNESAIFFGCYSNSDIDLINAHKGKKIVFILGADIPNISKLNEANLIFASGSQNILDVFKNLNKEYINKLIALKSYDLFVPHKKGSKIYCYINSYSDLNFIKHKVGLLKNAVKHFGESRFIFGVHGHTIYEVIEWYKKSFVNIQLNEMAGFTSALEMAHLGRRSVSNNKAPFCINYTDENSIIEIIEKEINTPLDYSVSDYLYFKKDWQQLLL